jgi:hypothetical protein
MKQVFVRVGRLHGNIKEMRPADVLGELGGGRMRVQVRGEQRPREVHASETVSMQQVVGQPMLDANVSAVPKSYPGRSSLFGMIGR